MTKFFLILATLLLVSCTGVTGRTFNELHSGMPQEEAMQKLGEADEITQKGDFEMHKYTNLYGAKKDGCNSCSKGVVKCDYYVVYKNGKVIKCGSIDPH